MEGRHHQRVDGLERGADPVGRPLQLLDLGTNYLSGEIPAELSNLSNLSELQLLGNQLTGCVPVGLRDVAEENDLGELDLPDCGLEGRPTASSFVSVSAGGSTPAG